MLQAGDGPDFPEVFAVLVVRWTDGLVENEVRPCVPVTDGLALEWALRIDGRAVGDDSRESPMDVVRGPYSGAQRAWATIWWAPVLRPSDLRFWAAPKDVRVPRVDLGAMVIAPDHLGGLIAGRTFPGPGWPMVEVGIMNRLWAPAPMDNVRRRA